MGEHKHQTISPIILRSSTSNPFNDSNHSIVNLSTYLTTYTSIRTPLQQSALNIYFTSERLSIYTLGVYSHFTDSEIIPAYFSLFDQLFFFSSLQSRCQVELVPRTGRGLNSYTIKSVSLPGGEIRSKIEIHILEDGEEWERKERLRAYLGILFHEMIHVFLLTYSCRREGCEALLPGMGKLGHGEAWHDIAFAAETAMRKLLGLEVDLLRKWCLVTELCLSGEPVRDAGVERWGFEGDEIAELVGSFGARVRREARMGLEFVRWAVGWSEKLKEIVRERKASSK